MAYFRVSLSSGGLHFLIALSLFWSFTSCGQDEDRNPKSTTNEKGNSEVPESTSKHEAYADEFVGLLKAVEETLESAKDADSGEKAAARLNGLTDETIALMERMKALGLPEGKGRERIAEKVGAYQRESDSRFEAALKAAMDNPEAAKHMKPAWTRMLEASRPYEKVAKGYGLQ